MTETSGREKVLEEAAAVAEKEADDAREQIEHNNEYARRSSSDASAANETCRKTIYVAEKIAEAIRALASPSTQEPAFRGGKVEEIAREIANRFFNVGYAGREHPEGAPSKGLCMQTYEGLQDDIAAAIRTYAGESAAQSERAGLERAAKWHDEQAKEYRERAKKNCLPGPYAIAITHEAAAVALRALSAARTAGGE